MCSFADPSCHSGWRYGELSPDELGEQCVGDISGPIAELALASDHSCAREDTGAVWCWGRNTYGALGDGSFVDRPTPVRVGEVDNATQVATGGQHTCAVDTGGAVWCWGNNEFGQLGAGDRQHRASPRNISSFASAESVVVGRDHTCAIQNKKVWCTGNNDRGQLGDDTDNERRTEPVKVQGIGNAVEVAAGDRFTCARTRSGAVQCWGHGDSGALGDGASRSARKPDKPVKLQHKAISIQTGANHACSQTEDGCVWCWGANDHGQLGHGGHDGQATPTAVRLSCWE